MSRLGSADTTYEFLRRALGWSVVLQVVWIFDDEIPTETLASMHKWLGQGRLHRRLAAAKVPGARPRWVPAGALPELVSDHIPVGPDQIESWAGTEMMGVDLDAGAGRCWRLRAAPTVSGGTALSLCALHLVADGRTLVRAAGEAMAHCTVAAPDGSGGDLLSEVKDAVAQVLSASTAVVAAGIGALGVGRGGEPALIDNRPPRAEHADRAPQASPAWATVSVPAADWDAAARAHGGTANSLYIAVVSGLLRSSCYAPPGDPIKVGVPVDVRAGAGDDSSNATAGVSVMLTDDPVPGGSLTAIRRSCKEAFSALSRRRPARGDLTALVWLLPATWLIGAVSAGNGMPDAMVSNLGDIEDRATRLGAATARRTAFRGMAQGVDPALPYRFGDGVQSWLLRGDDEITFCVAGFDESVFGGGRLRRLLAEELAAWQLTHDIW